MKPMPSSKPSAPLQQQGLSLVEVLVGMAIGLMVTLAAVSSLVFVRLSAATAEDAWRMQQESNTAFRIIGWQLRQAGARPLTAIGNSGTVEFANGFKGYGLASSPQPLSGSDGGGVAPDVLRTSLQNDVSADARDCLGLVPDKGTVDIVNQFSLVDGSLSCTGTDNVAAFVSGVEDFQVWYGESTVAGFQYLAQPLDWPRVTAVMVCLRLVGERQAQVTADTLGCNNEPVAADGRLRRTFLRVFQIRNPVETGDS